MSRIAAAFGRMRDERRVGLVTYVTAGDPCLERTGDVLRALDRAGADVLEVGVPFSDPLADGPVIQRACERALAAGTTLDRILDIIQAVRPSVGAPIVLFPRHRHVTLHHLQQLIEPFPREGRAQDRVPLDHPLPRVPERFHIEVAMQGTRRLREIHAGLGRVQRVKQHTLLHRRQRIDGFDGFGVHTLHLTRRFQPGARRDQPH